jgi:predicted NACHT family NTPase
MLYFNQKEYFPRNAEEAKQLTYILDFKENLPKEGLSWDYNGLEQFKEYVYDHLTKYLQHHFNKKSDPQINQPSITTISKQEIEKILDNYTHSLEKKVSKIRLLGDNKEYDLTEVFVDLIINEEYERPSFQSLDEYKGMMDYELRKKRILFSDPYEKEENDEKKDHKNKEEKDYNKKKIKPDDLLKSNKKTKIIVGAPGSGKSTLMRYLVNKILQHQTEKEYFPVYLELKKIQRNEVNDKDRFEDIVFSEAIISSSGINDNENEKSILKILRDKLRDGKIALFLDGLDEMKEVSKSFNVSLRNLFDKFIESEYIRNNLVIVTTRPYALQGRFESYKVQEMEITPFDIKQIKQFIIHYYGDGNPATKKFLDSLSTRIEMQELARVPLILGFLLQMYIKSKFFSGNKLELYDQIVHNLNNQLDKEKGIQRNFKITNPLLRLEVLTILAFSGLFNFNDDVVNRFVFTDNKILDEVKKYCYDKSGLNPYDLVEDIKATALLREIGNDRYSFTHLTIQEYLAATVLVKDKNNLVKLFSQAYFDPTICEMEVLSMTLGLLQSRWIGNSKVNLYELLEKLPESLNFANLRLRIKGLGYSPKKLDEKYLYHIVDRLVEFINEKNIDETSYKYIIFNVFSGLSIENTKYISTIIGTFKKT